MPPPPVSAGGICKAVGRTAPAGGGEAGGGERGGARGGGRRGGGERVEGSGLRGRGRRDGPGGVGRLGRAGGPLGRRQAAAEQHGQGGEAKRRPGGRARTASCSWALPA